jgi:hypothetical protein
LRRDEIDPVLKEKKRAHLIRFFGERPGTQELFPVQLGLVKRPNSPPNADDNDEPAAPAGVSARKVTDPTRQDDYVKTVQRNKLEKIFGVRPGTRDLVEAIQSVRGMEQPPANRPPSPSANRPGSPSSPIVTSSRQAPVQQQQQQQQQQPPQQQSINAAGMDSARSNTDPTSGRSARFQQTLVKPRHATSRKPPKPVATEPAVDAPPAPVVERHKQTLIEANDYIVYDAEQAMDNPELLYGQLLPESDDEFEEQDFVRDDNDNDASTSMRVRDILRASVLDRSRALAERDQMSRELLARRISPHMSREKLASRRNSGAFQALARLSIALTAAAAAPSTDAVERAQSVAWKLLTNDDDNNNNDEPSETSEQPPPPSGSDDTDSDDLPLMELPSIGTAASTANTSTTTTAASSTKKATTTAPIERPAALLKHQATRAALPEELGRRQYVVRELVITERNYINDIRTLVDMFLMPLCHDESLSEILSYDSSGTIVSLLSTAQLIVESAVVVFDNMAAACGEVSDPRPRLEPSTALDALVLPGERGETVNWGAAQVGDVFLHNSMSEVFTLFGIFVNHQTHVHDAITRAVAARKAVHAFLERQRLDVARSQGLTVFDYLVKPFQRSTKYVLLLRDLLKETPETHPDFAPLVAACELVVNETNHMNETKALSDNLRMLRDIAQRLELPKPHFVLVPRRRFIREGALLKDGRTERQFFLFNDVLVYAKRKTGNAFKAMAVVPVGDLVVTDVADSRLFLLHRRDKGKTYTLHAKDAKDKMEWVRDLQITVIRETSFAPPSLFQTGLDAVAVQSSGSAPPRAIIRLWFREHVQAFVISAETTAAQLLQQFTAKQATIASTGKLSASDFQVMLRRDNGLYCEERRLTDEERPVMLQHGLLKEGIVFGEDFDNCYVVRYVTEKPQNMASVRKARPVELPSGAAASSAPSLRGSGADSPKSRKLTLFKRSAPRSPMAESARVGGTDSRRADSIRAAEPTTLRATLPVVPPEDIVNRPLPTPIERAGTIIIDEMPLPSVPTTAEAPPSPTASRTSPSSSPPKKSPLVRSGERSPVPTVRSAAIAASAAAGPLLPARAAPASPILSPPATPSNRPAPSASTRGPPPARAPPSAPRIAVPASGGARPTDNLVRETVQMALLDVEALESSMTNATDPRQLRRDAILRNLVERVAQSREQLERYFAVGIGDADLSAVAHSVVTRATAALTFWRQASATSVAVSSYSEYSDVLLADESVAEDFVTSDIESDGVGEHHDDELVSDDDLADVERERDDRRSVSLPVLFGAADIYRQRTLPSVPSN